MKKIYKLNLDEALIETSMKQADRHQYTKYDTLDELVAQLLIEYCMPKSWA